MNRRDVLKLAGMAPAITPTIGTHTIERSRFIDGADYTLCIYGTGTITHMVIAVADDAKFAEVLDAELANLRQSILDYRDANREALVNGSST